MAEPGGASTHSHRERLPQAPPHKWLIHHRHVACCSPVHCGWVGKPLKAPFPFFPIYRTVVPTPAGTEMSGELGMTSSSQAL